MMPPQLDLRVVLKGGKKKPGSHPDQMFLVVMA